MESFQKLKVPRWVSFTKTWHTDTYDLISPLRPELSTAGKNVIVTGGGTGIGKATALAFALSGAKSVAILGRRIDRLRKSEAEILAQAPPEVQVVVQQVDLTSRDQVDEAFADLFNKFGKIDILVNNAGALPTPRPFTESSSDSYLQGFNANVLTSINAIQAFSAHASDRPIMLNISANLVHIQPMPGMSAYATSKAAAFKMVQYVAAENPHFHVVSLHPGLVETEIAPPESCVKGQDKGMSVRPRAFWLPIASLPLGLTILVELPANFCLWLASDEARFLKGKLVWANWDARELMEKAEEIESCRLLNMGLEGVPM